MCMPPIALATGDLEKKLKRQLARKAATIAVKGAVLGGYTVYNEDLYVFHHDIKNADSKDRRGRSFCSQRNRTC